MEFNASLKVYLQTNKSKLNLEVAISNILGNPDFELQHFRETFIFWLEACKTSHAFKWVSNNAQPTILWKQRLFLKGGKWDICIS